MDQSVNVIRQLALEPHPEGGYYRRLFTSPISIETGRGTRPSMTAIHYLLRHGEYSAFHRLISHELWYWHSGAAFLIHIIAPTGDYRRERLGPGDDLCVAVPPRHWFAAELDGEQPFGLASCTVTPGFDFDDFELGHVEDLVNLYPRHRDLICRLTR